MFIGEMGCWLIAFLRQSYNGWRSPPLEYVAVEVQDVPDEEESESIVGPAQPDVLIRCPKVPTAGMRRHISGKRILLLALPATCDIAGTTLMNIGLLLVAASVYQMTRGMLVLFVGLLSVIFLHRSLRLVQWTALFIVVFGVMLVGFSGFVNPHVSSSSKPESQYLDTFGTANKLGQNTNGAWFNALGITLIALAQIFTATQFVLEEHILERYELDPLKVVGWEGTFGFCITLIAMFVLHLLFGSGASESPFNMVVGWHQVIDNKAVAISSLLIMISIGGFNFFGLSVTRSVSATARSTIDTCRTLFIWMVSLALGWEHFAWLQILGFICLVYGTFLFNEIVRSPFRSCSRT